MYVRETEWPLAKECHSRIVFVNILDSMLRKTLLGKALSSFGLFSLTPMKTPPSDFPLYFAIQTGYQEVLGMRSCVDPTVGLYHSPLADIHPPPTHTPSPLPTHTLSTHTLPPPPLTHPPHRSPTLGCNTRPSQSVFVGLTDRSHSENSWRNMLSMELVMQSCALEYNTMLPRLPSCSTRSPSESEETLRYRHPLKASSVIVPVSIAIYLMG